MDTVMDISLEDTDTLQHNQPTNNISEEALALIKAWEASFSKPTNFPQRLEPDNIGLDFNFPTDLSQPPQRFHRTPRKIIK
jgi:hypothetical protein